MLACVAVAWSHGMSMMYVCVDFKNAAPFGSVMVMGFKSSCLLMTCAPLTMKWLVAPELLRAEPWWSEC